MGTQQREDPIQETLLDTEPKSKLVSHCHDSPVTHKIEELKIVDETNTANSVAESSHGVPHSGDSPDECTSVTGATCDDLLVPITAHHSPTKTTHCTSLFIDTVEWLSTIIVGTLDGKVGVFSYLITLLLGVLVLSDIMSQVCCQIGLLQLVR